MGWGGVLPLTLFIEAQTVVTSPESMASGGRSRHGVPISEAHISVLSPLLRSCWSSENVFSKILLDATN